MAVLAAALPYIVAVSAVAGTGVAVASSIQAGEERRKAGKFQANELNQQALEAKQSAGIKLAQQDQRAMAILSSIRATSAASGVSPESGSPLLDYATSSEQAQLNDMYTKYAANLTASGLNSQAQLTTYGANNSRTAGYITAAGDAVSGIGKLGTTALDNPKAFHID